MNRNLLKTLSTKGAGTIALKVAIVSTAVLGGVSVVSSSVFAALTATANNSSQSVTTGTLSLTQAPSGVVGLTNGFSTAITAMAPGDTVNRFVNVTNGGTLNAAAMSLKVVPGATTTLTSDATNGLQVTVMNCTIDYAASGACTGGTELQSYSGSANALLANNTLTNIVSQTAGAVSHFKFILALPAGSEVTTNGGLPGGTVQGVTVGLVWTFSETLRTNTNTNS